MHQLSLLKEKINLKEKEKKVKQNDFKYFEM
jgi:hypothetical protein